MDKKLNTAPFIKVQGLIENIRSGVATALQVSIDIRDGIPTLELEKAGEAMIVFVRCQNKLLVEVDLSTGQSLTIELPDLPPGQQVIRLACRIGQEHPIEAVTHLIYLRVGEIAPFIHRKMDDPVIDAVGNLLQKWELPGAVLASGTEGGEIETQALGWCDAAAGLEMSAHHRFRAASLGKVITTASIYQLLEQGKLSLDLSVSDALDMAARHRDIFDGVRISHLLRMSCGVRVDSAVGAPSPLDPLDMSERPKLHQKTSEGWLNSVLDTATRHFDPGDKFDYHTDNYWLLGRIIERYSGQSYADYVIQNVFDPLGLTDIRMATTLPDGRHHDEVIYHEGDCPPEPPQSAMGAKGMVPAPYQRVMPIRDAMGGWLVTAEEMVKLNQHLLDLTPALISTGSLESMLARKGAAPMPTEWYYGDGLFVQNPVGQGLPPHLTWWHFGLVPGCSGLLARIKGHHIALLVNGAPVKQNIFLASLWRVILKAVGK
mgnify:CR=1 FL=1